MICFGEENALLCTIGETEPTVFSYLYNVIDNFEGILRAKYRRSTILESKFDFTNSIIERGPYGVVHMDYTLYRTYEEEDSVYGLFRDKDEDMDYCFKFDGGCCGNKNKIRIT